MQRLERVAGSIFLIIFMTLTLSQLSLHEELSSTRKDVKKYFLKVQGLFLQKDELFPEFVSTVYNDELYRGSTFCYVGEENIRLVFLGDFEAKFTIESGGQIQNGIMKLKPYKDKIIGTSISGDKKAHLFTHLIANRTEPLSSFVLDGLKFTLKDCQLFGAR